jgi:hypothetical protein
MKKYIAIFAIIISGVMKSQVTIGKTENASAPVNTSVSLELGNATGGNRGLVLPWVSSASAVVGSPATVPAPALGTLIFDSSDQKVKYRRIVGGTTVWEDLSVGAQTPVSASLPDAIAENPASRVLIGGTPATDATRGVLVLADTNKAMILPRVSSVADIVNPSAGMMVYVTGTSNGTGVNANQLAVFNGREWTFWAKQ